MGNCPLRIQAGRREAELERREAVERRQRAQRRWRRATHRIRVLLRIRRIWSTLFNSRLVRYQRIASELGPLVRRVAPIFAHVRRVQGVLEYNRDFIRTTNYQRQRQIAIGRLLS